MNKIVIYYSMLGNTYYVAERIRKETGADLLRISPEKAYPDKGFRKFYWGGKSAIMAEKPKLLPYEIDLKQYDLIIFGTPDWASNFVPPLRTFIEENRKALEGKKIAAYVCCSGAGGNKVLNKLKDFIGIEAFETEAVFIDPKERKNNEEEISDFCKSIGL